MKRITLLLLIGAFWATTYAASGNTISQKHQQLEKFTHEITELKHDLHNNQQQRDVLTHQLKISDQKIGLLAQQVQQNSALMLPLEHQISEQQQQTEQLKQQLATQQHLLGAQLRASYLLGHHEYITLLLNQQNPGTITRLLTYYRYINQSRAVTIADIYHTEQQIEQTHAELQGKLAQLSQLRQQQQEQKSDMEATLVHHRRLIQQLNYQIIDETARLKEVENNRNHLASLLAQLTVNTNEAPQPHVPFAKMRKKLIWPTHGQLVNTYGQPIAHSELSYSGVTIFARQGAPVVNIYPGKVAFSGWLRGFGLLMIINHDHGYMSLYAHNQSLYKKRGDSVNAGELIATVGHSGGFDQNGLYFEVRSNGKPLNPTQWFTNIA